MRRSPFFLVAAIAFGCGKSKKEDHARHADDHARPAKYDPGRLVFTRDKATWILAPDDGTPKKLLDGGTNGAPIEDGKALFWVDGEKAYRVEVDAPEKKTLLAEGVTGLFYDVDDAGDLFATQTTDGPEITLDDGKKTKAQRVLLHRRGDAPIEVATARQVYGVAISPDGTWFAVSATPSTCTSVRLNPCTIELSYAKTAAPTSFTKIESGRINYAPRIVKGGPLGRDVLAFQTTANDPSSDCEKDINVCKHDLATFDGKAVHALQDEAFGPVFTDDGAWLEFLRMDEPSGCKKLPCDSASLYVRRVEGGEPVRVATSVFRNLRRAGFSRDGTWIGYVAKGAGASRPLKLCHGDGSACLDLGEKTYSLGWVR